MQSIGYRLRNERILKDISLEQLANSTKIPLSSLALIESDRFSELPNDTVIRGFIKSVCRVLGLDVESLLIEYSAKHARNRGGEIKPIKVTRNNQAIRTPSSKYRLLIALLIFLIFGSLLLLVIFAPSTFRGFEKMAGSNEQVVNVEK
jgi:cytoskeletal protein RodZ